LIVLLMTDFDAVFVAQLYPAITGCSPWNWKVNFAI